MSDSAAGCRMNQVGRLNRMASMILSTSARCIFPSGMQMEPMKRRRPWPFTALSTRPFIVTRSFLGFATEKPKKARLIPSGNR